MTRFVGLVAFIGILAAPASGQNLQMPGCLPQPENEPRLVANPDARVTFRCKDATAIDLIRAVGRQTRIPIGVVLGTHPEAISAIPHAYNLNQVTAADALSRAIDGTGYSVKEDAKGLVIMAGDLAPRQREWLTHEYDDFPTSSSQSLTSLGAMLTIWMRAAIDPTVGSGGSISGSSNDEVIAIHLAQPASTEQIARQIVTQGSRGMWIFKVDAARLPSDPMTDEIDIESYQHYTNSPAAYVSPLSFSHP